MSVGGEEAIDRLFKSTHSQFDVICSEPLVEKEVKRNALCKLGSTRKPRRTGNITSFFLIGLCVYILHHYFQRYSEDSKLG